MEFYTNVKIGNEILKNGIYINQYNKRYVLEELHEYIESNFEDGNNPYFPKICALYGLRRTGKTTMMLQEIFSFDEDKLSKTAWIDVTNEDDMMRIYSDLKKMQHQGIRYVFIDEITKAKNFIRVSSLLSDVYARCGMHVIITGTDSLGIYLARKNELFDRVITIHTTYIPYYEYKHLFPNASVDDYIENGGLLSQSGINYNNEKIIDEYVDSAIAENIQHSLEYMKDDRKLGSLFHIQKRGELTNIINRVVENQNHIFALETVLEDFQSRDIGSMMDLLAKKIHTSELIDIVSNINVDKITETIKTRLRILNESERNTVLTEGVMGCIEEYFEYLDFIETCDHVLVGKTYETICRNLLVQPAIRYNQAKVAIDALSNDKAFKRIPKGLKGFMKDKMLSDIKGRMLEEIVLLHLVKSFDDAEIQSITFKQFKHSSFTDGEYDAVLWKDDADAILIEIKHNCLMDYENQTRHLRDVNKLEWLQENMYNVTQKIVLYNGSTQSMDKNGIQYVNVGEYLESLKNYDRNYQKMIEREHNHLIMEYANDPTFVKLLFTHKIDTIKVQYPFLSKEDIDEIRNLLRENQMDKQFENYESKT